MKKTMITGLAGVMAVGLFAATALAVEGTTSTITGELVDMGCYLKSGMHGAGHATCGANCAKAGMPVGVLEDNGKVYTLDVPSKALAPEMAKTVRVTGEIFKGTDVIMPTTIRVQGEEGTWTKVKLPEKFVRKFETPAMK
ncbi:MAG TPA: hypothetical protein VKA67_05500 [Verrucomicrobiae bacterium]|nr:hypothetical protein [Verrucomicrobiae bacterium]